MPFDTQAAQNMTGQQTAYLSHPLHLQQAAHLRARCLSHHPLSGPGMDARRLAATSAAGPAMTTEPARHLLQQKGVQTAYCLQFKLVDVLCLQASAAPNHGELVVCSTDKDNAKTQKDCRILQGKVKLMYRCVELNNAALTHQDVVVVLTEVLPDILEEAGL